MSSRNWIALGLCTLLATPSFADFRYDETTQITGGTVVSMMKLAGAFSKDAKKAMDPVTSTVLVQGNRMARVNPDRTEIIDLDKETITHIDTERKTYTVMTFAQMRQAAADMMKRIQQAPPQQAAAAQQPKSDLKTSFEVSVKNTGLSKSVNGLDAQEQVVDMQMHVTNPNGAGTEAQNTITYTVTTDAWIAPDPPEVKEIQDFDARMGKKMMEGADLSAFKPGGTNAGLAQIFGSKPGTAEAMTQMQKEMAKLKGTRVMEVTRMGGDAPAGTQTTAGTTPGTTSTGTSVATQVATDTAGQTAASESGRLGVVGSALGNSLLGAFRRQTATQPAPPAPAPAPATTVAGTQPTTRVVLMEMTMQKSNFSQEAIPPSAFAVPDGFKQMPSAYDQMSK